MVHLTALALALLAALVLSGCGGHDGGQPAAPAPAGRTTYHDDRHGFTVRLPPDWHRARENLAPDVVQPREIVSLGTYPLRYEAGDRCSAIGAPMPRLDRMRPGDVLVSVQERVGAGPGHPALPRRTRPFRLRPLNLAGKPRCAARRIGSIAFQAFGDAGRVFYMIAVIGRKATARTRREMQRVIDSFRFERDATPTRWRTYRDRARGVEVRLPDGWRRAPKSLTPRLTDPREIFAAGTYPLRYRPTNCEAFAGSAREDLGRRDALVVVQEQGNPHSPGFPPRPRSFAGRPAQPGGPGCGEHPGADTWWLPFRDAGRRFYALVVIGREGSWRTRSEAFALLDSLRFDPG